MEISSLSMRKWFVRIATLIMMALFIREAHRTDFVFGSAFSMEPLWTARVLTVASILFAVSPLPTLLIELIWLVAKGRAFTDASLFRLMRFNADRETDLVAWMIYRSGFLPTWVFSGPALAIAYWMMDHRISPLSHYLEAQPLIAFVAVYLINSGLDFLLHVIWHRVPAFWELHKIHHAAEEFTVLTQHREHPILILLTNLIKGSLMALIGAPGGIFVLALILRNLQIGLQHSVVDSDWGWFGRFFISPHAHHLHHSSNPEHHNRNFGFDITLWDRLLGTFMEKAHADEKIRFGIDNPGPHQQNIASAVMHSTARFLSLLGPLLRPLIRSRR